MDSACTRLVPLATAAFCSSGVATSLLVVFSPDGRLLMLLRKLDQWRVRRRQQSLPNDTHTRCINITNVVQPQHRHTEHNVRKQQQGLPRTRWSAASGSTGHMQRRQQGSPRDSYTSRSIIRRCAAFGRRRARATGLASHTCSFDGALLRAPQTHVHRQRQDSLQNSKNTGCGIIRWRDAFRQRRALAEAAAGLHAAATLVAGSSDDAMLWAAQGACRGGSRARRATAMLVTPSFDGALLRAAQGTCRGDSRARRVTDAHQHYYMENGKGTPTAELPNAGGKAWRTRPSSSHAGGGESTSDRGGRTSNERCAPH
ncbi:hypothetical protein OAO87_02620 [bacterium]|nr:hypothetical protein [bacterium]